MRVVSQPPTVDVKGVETVQSDLLARGGRGLASMRIDCCVYPRGCVLTLILTLTLTLTLLPTPPANPNPNQVRRAAQDGQGPGAPHGTPLMDALLPTAAAASSRAASARWARACPPPAQAATQRQEPYGGFPWPYALTKFQV